MAYKHNIFQLSFLIYLFLSFYLFSCTCVTEQRMVTSNKRLTRQHRLGHSPRLLHTVPPTKATPKPILTVTQPLDTHQQLSLHHTRRSLLLKVLRAIPTLHRPLMEVAVLVMVSHHPRLHQYQLVQEGPRLQDICKVQVPLQLEVRVYLLIHMINNRPHPLVLHLLSQEDFHLR